MSTFKVKIVGKDGETSEKTLEASEQLDVYRQVKDGGGTVISVEEVTSGKLAILDKIFTRLSGIRTSEKIIFARNLGNMLGAGLTVSRSLAVIERQTKNKRFIEVVASLRESINKGSSFSEALKKFPKIFPQLFVAMSHAGEESGNLSGSLSVVAEQMDKSYQLQKRIKGAMIYPGIVLTIMLGIGVLLMIYVVPTLTKTFTSLDVELPLATRLIIGASNFISGNILLLASILVLLIALFSVVVKSKRGRRVVDFLILHLPVLAAMTREINAARTTRTMSSLLSSGVGIIEAINITGEVVQNSYYKDVLREAGEKIQKGETISKVLNAHINLYPVFVVEMASVGEETGQLPKMFLNTAQYYENEVELKTKNMSTIIEPLLMVIIGIGVGIFALAVIGPIYSLADKI